MQVAARDNRAKIRLLCVTEDDIDLQKEWIEPPPYVRPPPPKKPVTPEDPNDKLPALETF
jgi:hypothetical protein